MTYLNMEAVVDMPASLICVEFERMLKILDKECEGELFLMDEQEKCFCVGKSQVERYLMYCQLMVVISLCKYRNTNGCI